MAKRKFNLPGIQDLSKEQEDARALSKRGRHLIVGGPGTGKSVVALLRSRRHHEDKDDYVFLVYNHLLNQASRHLFGSNLISKTWNSWFASTFHQATKQNLPLLPARQGSQWQDTDWDQVLDLIDGINVHKTPNYRPFMIIDEGQDMPPNFYLTLMSLGFENFYVVADQNQQIVSGQNSSRKQIADLLSIKDEEDDTEVIELKENYRNSYPAARLAREFYTGDPAAPPPDLPPIQRTAKKPILVEYGNGCTDSFESAVVTILKTADRDPSRLLGVIAPNNKIRKKYFDALSSAKVKLDNGRPRIRTYATGDNSQLDFHEGGIMVINAQSCKGLEFDIVFLADIDQHYCNPSFQDEKKRLFYVMVARTRDNIIMLKNANNHCPVEVILPNNEEILERRR